MMYVLVAVMGLVKSAGSVEGGWEPQTSSALHCSKAACSFNLCMGCSGAAPYQIPALFCALAVLGRSGHSLAGEQLVKHHLCCSVSAMILLCRLWTWWS